MGQNSCDGCGRTVTVAGGMANFWTFGDRDGSDGTAMTLAFEDGSEHLLCYPCIAALPDHATAADVEQLEQVDAETSRLA
ncbi:DUF7561 family protein [Halosolutus gelatinilyticus]|uniref:DUF7561 family protein n=1 Tax=Halosolutus gelatinilyticus TaxID=2931975 RepID=UPI001FF3AA11|nr:hypothetical protein [Halosolutus gelatinilyticus]